MLRPRRIVVAINPNAAFGRGREVGPAVVTTLRGLGHDVVSLTELDFPQLLDATRRALTEKPDALVVVGGDGMVALGVMALEGSRIPLGIVPSGTGNDVCRGLGIPVDDAEAAIRMLAEQLDVPPRVIDAGTIAHAGGETRFACILSAGFDALVNERANRMRFPRGRSRYTLALLIELAKLRPIEYTLELDGETRVERALLVAVANNLSFGGGMKVAPDAKLDDGLFDVVLVKPLSRLQFLRIYPRVFAGTHVGDPRVIVHRASRVSIAAAGVVAYADGERVAPLPVSATVDARSLRVLAPTP